MTTKLTPFGEIAARYGVQTPPKFWADTYKEITQIADHDGDWQQMIDERIAGLRVLKVNYYSITNGGPVDWSKV